MSIEREEEQKMNRRKTSGAVMVCAAMMLIVAAPLVQSETEGTEHLIYKDENGPPSTCKEEWQFVAPSNGTWYGFVNNYGMRWLIIDVFDMDDQDLIIDREMYRYAVTGDTFFTDPAPMVVGHTYLITGTPNGPLDTYCTVEDIFEPDEQPPVAAFTLSVDGLTVSVDATPSNDPDGTIVAYDWDWGDGSTDTGVTAEHTYVPPPGDGVKEFAVSSPVLGSETPHPIAGTCYDIENNPLPDCTVTVTYWETETISYSGTTMSDETGQYQFDISSFPGLWLPGKYVEVEAVKGPLYGYADGYTTSGFIDFIDVVLEGEPQEPFDVTITLTVTDNDGLTSTWSETVTLYP